MFLVSGGKVTPVISGKGLGWNVFLWNVGLVSNEFGYLIEISKQGFEGVGWFLFTTYGKMREERDKLKSLLNKKKL